MKTRWAIVMLVAMALPGMALAQDPEAGIALFNQGQFAEAEAALRGGGGPDAQAYLAASLAKQKKYGEAEAPANAALAENATHPVALAALGESLVGQKKYDAAVERLTKAVEAQNDLAYAYYWRGHAWNAKGQPGKAVADFEAFVKLQPEAPETPVVQRLLAGLR